MAVQWRTFGSEVNPENVRRGTVESEKREGNPKIPKLATLVNVDWTYSNSCSSAAPAIKIALPNLSSLRHSLPIKQLACSHKYL